MNELYRSDTAVINLQPLPQTSENHWNYTNVDENGYHKLFNFTLLKPLDNPWKQLRLSVLKEAFQMAKNALILGSGAMYNKKAFFEYIYPEIKFSEISLNEKIKIFYSLNPKIVLSAYYSSYNGLGLNGLKLVYHFIIDKNLV